MLEQPIINGGAASGAGRCPFLVVWPRQALLAAPRRGEAPVALDTGFRLGRLPPGTISGPLGVC